jgi:uncharacterized protein (TIGR00369 family)
LAEDRLVGTGRKQSNGKTTCPELSIAYFFKIPFLNAFLFLIRFPWVLSTGRRKIFFLFLISGVILKPCLAARGGFPAPPKRVEVTEMRGRPPGGAMEVVADGGCFACGPENTGGLRGVFHQEPASRSARCELSLAPTFQGWQGIVHGGVLATLLDETAVHACRAEVEQVMTAELGIKYRSPAKIGVVLMTRATIRERRRNLFIVDAEIRQGETLIASAEVKVIALNRSPQSGD